MSGWPAALLTGLLLLGAVLVAPGAAAQSGPPEPADSRDPYGLERYPRSWIVDYRRDPEVRPREFVMSRVDRIRRELRVAERLRVAGTLETVTYQMPEGTPVAEVVEYFRRTLGGDVLFRCEGRGCGRSNDWANQIFGKAILYGPDANQYYAAREWQDRLVSLYVIERGNRRVYAHLEFIDPADAGAMEANALLVRRLAERGWAPIEGVVPGSDGGISAEGRARLAAVAGQLTDFAGRELYVVCHLYGEADPGALLASSQRCAAAAADVLVAGAGEGAAPALQSFGAGPLLPRSPDRTARLELVLPDAAAPFGGD